MVRGGMLGGSIKTNDSPFAKASSVESRINISDYRTNCLCQGRFSGHGIRYLRTPIP